jgi:hypothetical protein
VVLGCENEPKVSPMVEKRSATQAECSHPFLF